MKKNKDGAISSLTSIESREHLCRKGRRAADINYYVQWWARGLIAHIVSLFIGLDGEQEA